MGGWGRSYAASLCELWSALLPDVGQFESGWLVYGHYSVFALHVGIFGLVGGNQCNLAAEVRGKQGKYKTAQHRRARGWLSVGGLGLLLYCHFTVDSGFYRHYKFIKCR